MNWHLGLQGHRHKIKFILSYLILSYLIRGCKCRLHSYTWVCQKFLWPIMISTIFSLLRWYFQKDAGWGIIAFLLQIFETLHSNYRYHGCGERKYCQNYYPVNCDRFINVLSLSYFRPIDIIAAVLCMWTGCKIAELYHTLGCLKSMKWHA